MEPGDVSQKDGRCLDFGAMMESIRSVVQLSATLRLGGWLRQTPGSPSDGSRRDGLWLGTTVRVRYDLVPRLGSEAGSPMTRKIPVTLCELCMFNPLFSLNLQTWRLSCIEPAHMT